MAAKRVDERFKLLSGRPFQSFRVPNSINGLNMVTRCFVHVPQG